jgi:hypothetical protein
VGSGGRAYGQGQGKKLKVLEGMFENSMGVGSGNGFGRGWVV